MARGSVAKANMLLLRSCRRGKHAESGLSKFIGTAEGCGVAKSGRDSTSSWVPHPRTGIYFPVGHEWVMEDVPEGAASFGQTCWFRDVDGVDCPNPDAPHHPSPSTLFKLN